MLNKYKPDLKRVLTFCCAGAVASELVKVFSMIQLVPSSDGSFMTPFMEPQHLPFHLCSIQLIIIFYVRFAKEGSARTALLAFMYPTCAAGAFLALLMPSIFTNSIDVTQAFTHPIGYQYFLYHSMLIVLGIYIITSRQVDIQKKHYWSTVGILAGMAFISLYLNSWLASPNYQNGELVSVDYTPNFFFTYETPIGIQFTEIWQWYLYLGIIIVLAFVMIALFYIPVFRRKK